MSKSEVRAHGEAAKFEWFDISDETKRVYHYKDYVTFTISEPAKLNVKRDERGDSHRVIAKDGRGFYVAPGWLAIEWTGKTTF